MDGKKRPQLKDRDFNDPFNAGQMVGMLVMLTFIENHPNMPQKMIDELKQVTAHNAQIFLQKPTEDIFLLIDNLVKEI